MRDKVALFALAFFVTISAALLFDDSRAQNKTANAGKPDNNLVVKGEKHLSNIKQLSFGGENAEAYFVADGSKLIFQSKRDGRQCDQIYTMNTDGSDVKMVSTGEVTAKPNGQAAEQLRKVGYADNVIRGIESAVAKGIITDPSQVGGSPEYRGEPYADRVQQDDNGNPQ